MDSNELKSQGSVYKIFLEEIGYKIDSEVYERLYHNQFLDGEIFTIRVIQKLYQNQYIKDIDLNQIKSLVNNLLNKSSDYMSDVRNFLKLNVSVLIDKINTFNGKGYTDLKPTIRLYYENDVNYDNISFDLRRLLTFGGVTKFTGFKINLIDKIVDLFIEDYKVRFMRYYYLLINNPSSKKFNSDELLMIASSLALYNFGDFKVQEYFFGPELFTIDNIISGIRILEGDIILI